MADRLADQLCRAVASVPAGARAEDDAEVQLLLADAVATGRPEQVVACLARAVVDARVRTPAALAWGIYVDRLRRTGQAHRGLSARCTEVLTSLESGSDQAALRAARAAYDVHGKRALWWFAHVLRDLG